MMRDIIVISLQSWRKATQVIGEFLKKISVYELLLDIRGMVVMEQKKWIKNTSGVWRFLGRKKMFPEIIAGRSYLYKGVTASQEHSRGNVNP